MDKADLKLVVLISGAGSNLQALIEREHKGNWGATIVGVLSNNPKASGLAFANQAAIPTAILDHRLFSTRGEFDKTLLAAVRYFQPDLVLLAGFMRILSLSFIEPLQHQILNIHPSLLPAYKGLHTHEAVLSNQDPWHGASVHWVTETLDNGPVVGQVRVPVFTTDTIETLKERVHHAEHYLYPAVIEGLAQIGKHHFQHYTQPLKNYDPTTHTIH